MNLDPCERLFFQAKTAGVHQNDLHPDAIDSRYFQPAILIEHL